MVVFLRHENGTVPSFPVIVRDGSGLNSMPSSRPRGGCGAQRPVVRCPWRTQHPGECHSDLLGLSNISGYG